MTPDFDPREQLGELSDEFPVLLFPVRLETRFKTITEDDAEKHQLWVRVYPDACLIDTFEATLSDTEVRNARAYWQGVWRAAGFEDDERAAWRNLVASHGSGRAAWIVERHRPRNFDEKPKARTDVVLVVPTDTPLPDAEHRATIAYWRGVWLADGDRAAENAALSEFRGAAGDSRAAELVEAYVPFNLDDRPAPAAQPPVVSVAFVVFPVAVETKREAWTRPARVELLPDRFVLAASSGGEMIECIGEPVRSPLIVGPDPSAPASEQLRPDDGELVIPEDLRWMVDFERAVDWGLGFKVELTETQARHGLEQLLVLGVRSSATAEEEKAQLEQLIRHHCYGAGGFGIVPQGTPTNNTETAGAGFTRAPDAEASFDDLKRPARPSGTDDPLRKKDGQWLAELLGIDARLLEQVPHSSGSDQSEARAMNRVLWPATLGYFMETMMSPVFDEDDVEHARWFFIEHVSGRGAIPSIRIGGQPYGVLATTAFSRIGWLEGDGDPIFGKLNGRRRFLARLLALLRRLDAEWTAMADKVAFVGQRGDPHRTLLDVLGLHPGSVEYHHRYAESLEHAFNHVNLYGLGAMLMRTPAAPGLDAAARQLIRELGYSGDDPDLLTKYFLASQQRLAGDVVDDRPLSESDRVRIWTGDGRNYIEWLRDAASTSLETLRLQTGFKDGPPIALLYLLLRHALILGYSDASSELHRSAGFMTADEVRVLKREPRFVHVAGDKERSESRWTPLYSVEPRITGSDGLTVAEHIARELATVEECRRLREQIEALELLDVPTARLERTFAEHIDCCSYRFDAWLLGLVHHQLTLMRYEPQGDRVVARPGLYLGAYGLLEDIRPTDSTLAPVALDRELQPVFSRDGEPPLMRDPTNGGYIHAPSLDQAVTAAVLRNGYLSNATSADPRPFAVDLSSERVRLALSLLQGMRNGQSLGALLGYRLERGLHDRHDVAEVDRFVFALRKAFPLRADRLAATKTDANVPIEAIEARNVVDGRSLVDHVHRTRASTYPFGLSLPAADEDEAAAINAEVERLLDIHDALADLALAEGVHQAVQGNYERVAGTLETYTRGHYPPEPDVVRTPATGITLTHRVALHLEAGLSAPMSDPTPRSLAEPALNSWLGGVLPPLDTIACTVVWTDPVDDAPMSARVSMHQLGLQPIDLLRLVRRDREQAMTELDDRVLRHVIADHAPRPDAELSIRYLARTAGTLTVFEVAPLITSLQSLVARSRPLAPGDLALPNAPEQPQNDTVFANAAQVTEVKRALDTLARALAQHLADIRLLAASAPRRQAELLVRIDELVADAVTLLARAADFGIPQAAWGAVLEWRSAQFRRLIDAIRALLARWDAKLGAFADRIAQYNALVPSVPEAERLATLRSAEREISTSLVPLPATPAELNEAVLTMLREAVLAKKDAFVGRRSQFAALVERRDSSLATLLASLRALLPISDFDPDPFPLDDNETQVVSFAAELGKRIAAVAGEVDGRREAAEAQLALHAKAASGRARVHALDQAGKALLGDDVRILPEFALAPAQGDEWHHAVAAASRGELFAHRTGAQATGFPVDEWLYGVARVRDTLRLWERIVLLAGGFGQREPELTPAQLPHRAGDHWLALEFPAEDMPDRERLLYTAHYTTPFDKSRPQCGLLLDEWTEVIPTDRQLTGISFHFNRPSCEAPQTLLLVTPAAWDGRWHWDDLVAAIKETLELAKKRAVEPEHVDANPLARFLPATVMAATVNGISIGTAVATNNKVADRMTGAPDG